MSRSKIQTVNPTTQAVAVNGIISLGSVLRRYGCNCKLSGNAIEISGCGYYDVTAAVTVEPTAAGQTVVSLFENGNTVPSAYGEGTAAAAGDPVTVPIVTTVRLFENGTSNLTFVLTEGAGDVTNISVRVDKG